MKAALSNWFDAPSPVLVKSHCAPISAFDTRFQCLYSVIGWLAAQLADLEEPAQMNTPSIRTALDAVRAEGQARLVRMSGSGATVFGLYDDAATAARAAEALSEAHPCWWVRAARLG